MPGYLLDTNIISALVREPHGKLAQRIARAGERQVRTNIIVAAELRFGAVRRNSPRLTMAIESMLNELVVEPLEPPTDRVYAQLRAKLERDGALIGGDDMLIAAHCMALDCTLVSDNEREFARVADLRLENWLR